MKNNESQTPLNGTFFSAPLRGISKFTGLFFAKKTQKIISYLLNETSLRTLLLALGLALLFLLWGLFLYTAIGDKGSPTWSFGALDDVPGLSPYSTAGPQEAPRLRPSPLQNRGRVREQHIMGPDHPPSPASGGTP